MIDFVQLLWHTLLIPLSWLPPFCQNVLAWMVTAVVAFVVISIIVKIASAKDII